MQTEPLSDLELIYRTAKDGYSFSQVYDTFREILKIEKSSGTSDAQTNLRIIIDHSNPSNFTERKNTFLQLLRQNGSSGTSKTQQLFRQVYN